MLWLFPEMPFAHLYTWALLNYFIVFLNLIPLLELDGYWILADVIQVPDLRPRSRKFIRHDLWRKLRTGADHEAGGGPRPLRVHRRGVHDLLALHGVRLLGDGVRRPDLRAVDAGLVGRLFLAALILFLAGPIIRALISLARIAFRKVKGLADALQFRLQTKWRVEAAHVIDRSPMFDDLPEDLLSDLAGRVALGRYPAASRSSVRATGRTPSTSFGRGRCTWSRRIETGKDWCFERSGPATCSASSGS